MPRKAQGVHTNPENAGAQNFPLGYEDEHKDEMGTMKKVLPVMKHGKHVLEAYKGLWTEELLEAEIMEYFQYCDEVSLKPCKAGLRVWLNISKAQYYEWETNSAKYGSKSDLLKWASDTMEQTYIERGEKYPTMNTFLLRTSHGHVEASKLDITSNGQTVNSADEVHDLVAKLGLDKK